MPTSPTRRLAAALSVAALLALVIGVGPARAAAQLALGPPTWDAGPATVDTDGATQSFNVKNIGDKDGTPGPASLSGSDPGSFVIESDGCAAATLAPSDSCTVQVRFHPPAGGSPNRTASLDFATAAPSIVSASLTGVATDPASLSAQPGALDFGVMEVDRGSTSRSVNVQNVGGSPASIDIAVIEGAGAGAYRIDGTNCPSSTLQPGASCNVQVSFDPNDPVPYSAVLRVGGRDGEVVVPLTGIGGSARLSPDPSELDFGTVDVGDEATRTVRVRNDGNLPFQTIVILPSGGDVGAFRVVADSCSLQQLAPGNACELSVRFSPLRLGPAEAGLLVIQGDGQPLVLRLHGSGRQARAVLTPGGADFGTQATGTRSATRSFRVDNTGDAALRVSNVTVGGADAGQFQLVGESCTAAPVAPGASCAARVRFAPEGAGARAATLRVASNDAAGVVSATLTGEGSAQPATSGTARIAFDARSGLPAPIVHRRVDLGTGRCVSARVCAVTIRASFVRGRSSAALAGRAVRLRVGRGTRILLRLPGRLGGRARLAVVRFRVSARGQGAGTQSLRAALVPGRRVGDLVFSPPPDHQRGGRTRLGTYWCAAGRRACGATVSLARRSKPAGVLTTISARLSLGAAWALAVRSPALPGTHVLLVRNGSAVVRVPLVLRR